MNRRGFIKNVGVASTAAIVVPTIIPACSAGTGSRKAPSDIIEMVVVGAGSMGKGNMKEFLKNPDVRVVAVCDVDKSRRDLVQSKLWKAYGNKDCKSFNNHEELLDKMKFHTASIAVPDQWHATLYKDFADAKIDIYGEKPLVRKINEAAKVVDAVEKSGIVWQTGSWQRSVDYFHRACELVANGVIGDIQRVEIGLPDFNKEIGMPAVQPVPAGVDYDRWTGPAQKLDFRGVLHWDWRWIMNYSGGQLTDWCGHHVDIALWGMGIEESGPKEVKGTATRNSSDLYNVPHTFDFDIKFKNDIPVRLTNESQLEHGSGVTWYGKDDWVHVTRGGMTCSREEIANADITKGKRLYKSTDHRKNFIDCVVSREKCVTPVDSASRAIVTGLLSEVAYLTGETVYWDDKKRAMVNPTAKALEIAKANARGKYTM